MRGHTASQSPAISMQPPREFRKISIILLVSRLVPRNHRKSPEKTIQNRSRERLRGSQNRLKIGRGPSWDAPWQPRAVRERLGSVLGRPRRGTGAPRESPKTLRDARKSVRECPGARRGDQNQPQVASGSEKIVFLSPGSCAKRHRSDCSSIFIDLCFLCEVCEPSKVLRLPAKTKVRPLALRVESVARCNLEKRRKPDSELIQKLRNYRNFRTFRHLRDLRKLRNIRKIRAFPEDPSSLVRDDPPR